MPAKNSVKQSKGTGPKKHVEKKVAKTPPKKAKVEPVEVKVEPVEVKVEPVDAKVKAELVAPAEDILATDTTAEFVALANDLETTLQMVRAMKARLRDLEKNVIRERKEAAKKMKSRKKRVVDPNAEPSGFAKPGPVSEELCKFLGLEPGSFIARTEVTKGINKYCKEHSLQKESDKRTILPDKELKILLRLKKGDDVTFFNLQKYMKVHFPNKEGVYPTA